MEFEFAYRDYCFNLKYYYTLHTYNIWFRLLCNSVCLSNVFIFCPFNNQFTFHNYFPSSICDDFKKGIRENQKKFDSYIKKIKFQTSPFFIGV